MPTVDNPATRLRNELVLAQTTGQQTALQFWCRRWSLDPAVLSDRLECVRLGASLVEAAVTCRRRAEAVGDAFSRIALESFSQIESVVDRFSLMPSTTVDGFFAGLDNSGHTSVRLLEEVLSREDGPASELTAIDELILKCRELIDGITTSDLPPEVTLELVERVRELELALQRINIRGPETATRAADGLLGVCVRLHLRGVSAANHPLARAAVALAVAVAGGLDVAANYAQLAGSDLGQVLGLPGGTTPSP